MIKENEHWACSRVKLITFFLFLNWCIYFPQKSEAKIFELQPNDKRNNWLQEAKSIGFYIIGGVKSTEQLHYSVVRDLKTWKMKSEYLYKVREYTNYKEFVNKIKFTD